MGWGWGAEEKDVILITHSDCKEELESAWFLFRGKEVVGYGVCSSERETESVCDSCYNLKNTPTNSHTFSLYTSINYKKREKNTGKSFVSTCFCFK